MALREVLAREVRVAFSPRAQPVWFRALKWLAIVALTVRFWRSPTFWRWLLGAFGASVAIHLIWRHNTRGWTRPWGGWSDVAAGESRPSGPRQEDMP